ncbi:MAG: hypothetical protein EA381_05605 [Planctomycetaceae bacterium]|nr:MAG: hypothetical protein EA381_05605 [Planctomycetaceae bacterium]
MPIVAETLAIASLRLLTDMANWREIRHRQIDRLTRAARPALRLPFHSTIHDPMKVLLLPVWLLVIPVAFVGCGGGDLPTTVPVTGTVTLDGNPVDGATVNFMSDTENRLASGKTDASGKFTLQTIVGSQTAPGAVVGGHGVAVLKSESGGQMTEDPKAIMEQMTTNPAITSDYTPKYIIPAKYNNPTMSGIRVEVTQDGPNDITIELTSR